MLPEQLGWSKRSHKSTLSILILVHIELLVALNLATGALPVGAKGQPVYLTNNHQW